MLKKTSLSAVLDHVLWHVKFDVYQEMLKHLTHNQLKELKETKKHCSDIWKNRDARYRELTDRIKYYWPTTPTF